MDLDLATQVPIEIDNAQAITSEEFSVRSQRPMRIRKGALGPLGKSKGVFTYSGNVKFVVPKAGLEFDFEELKSRDTGFTLSYSVGTMRFLLTGVEIEGDELPSNAENGDVAYTFSFQATGRIKTA